jgi:hypothetical protein
MHIYSGKTMTQSRLSDAEVMGLFIEVPVARMSPERRRELARLGAPSRGVTLYLFGSVLRGRLIAVRFSKKEKRADVLRSALVALALGFPYTID